MFQRLEKPKIITVVSDVYNFQLNTQKPFIQTKWEISFVAVVLNFLKIFDIKILESKFGRTWGNRILKCGNVKD